jgi:hypothetical protein
MKCDLVARAKQLEIIEGIKLAFDLGVATLRRRANAYVVDDYGT